MFNRLYTIILAAGESSRFGMVKQTREWQGETLLQLSIRRAQHVCMGRVMVVLGAHAEQIRPTLPDDIMTIFNPVWQEGMASSLRTGLAALPIDAKAVMIMTCDQPLIQDSHLSALVKRWCQSPRSIVASSYDGTQGVPAIFPQHFFHELLSLTGDHGARPLIHANKECLQTIPIPEAAIDIDTQDDMQALLSAC